MLLRPGNAGSNTFADHLAVLTAALRQIPSRMRSRLLVRVDRAGASHELIDHLLSLSSRRRTVLFTCGWAITSADEQAIGLLPAAAWQAAGVVAVGSGDVDVAVQVQKADGQIAQRRHDARRVSCPDQGLVFLVGDVADPVDWASHCSLTVWEWLEQPVLGGG